MGYASELPFFNAFFSFLACLFSYPLILLVISLNFTNGFAFPFYIMMVLSLLPFFFSLIYFFVSVIQMTNPNESLFYLPSFHMFLIGVFYSGSFILSTWSLTWPPMTLYYYLQIHAVSDLLFQPIFSSIILRRSFRWLNLLWFILLLAIIFADYTCEPTTLYLWTVTLPTSFNYEGFVIAAGSRLLFNVAGPLSKYFLLIKGYQHKFTERERIIQRFLASTI
jgi:hypothetical protein